MVTSMQPVMNRCLQAVFARLGNKVAAKHRQKEFVTVGSPKYYSDPPPPSATFLQKAGFKRFANNCDS